MLETLYLAWRLITRGTNKKCEIRSKEVRKGSPGVLLKFCDPLYISGTVCARNFRFGVSFTSRDTNEKNAKFGQRGWEGVMWPNFSVVTQTEASVDFPLYSHPLEKSV